MPPLSYMLLESMLCRISMYELFNERGEQAFPCRCCPSDRTGKRFFVPLATSILLTLNVNTKQMKRQLEAHRQITDEAAGNWYLRRFGFNVYEAANNEDAQGYNPRRAKPISRDQREANSVLAQQSYCDEISSRVALS